MIMKFKPVYNFQSVEFEYEIESEEDLDKAMFWFKTILEKMQDIAPDQPAPTKAAAPKEPMATDKQIATLKKLGVAEQDAKKLTTKQAYTKIKELIGD